MVVLLLLFEVLNIKYSGKVVDSSLSPHLFKYTICKSNHKNTDTITFPMALNLWYLKC